MDETFATISCEGCGYLGVHRSGPVPDAFVASLCSRYGIPYPAQPPADDVESAVDEAFAELPDAPTLPQGTPWGYDSFEESPDWCQACGRHRCPECGQGMEEKSTRWVCLQCQPRRSSFD